MTSGNWQGLERKSYRPPGVAERIIALRQQLGLSQREIQGPGVSYAYISRVERGDRKPSLDALIVLADRLQTTALYLLTGDRRAECPLCQRKK